MDLNLGSCDKCSAQSQIVFGCPDHPDDPHLMVLCNHHGNKYLPSLLDRYWKIVYDQRQWKIEESTDLTSPSPVS